MIRDKSFRARSIHSLIVAAVILTTVISLAPILHTLALSFSGMNYATAGLVYFWPKGMTLDAYEKILGDT